MTRGLVLLFLTACASTPDATPSDDTDSVDTDPAQETDSDTPVVVDTDTDADTDTHTDTDSDTDGDSDTEPPDPCDDPTPRLVVGTGEDGFLPLSPGDPLEIVQGPQGGWHLTGAVRALHLPGALNVGFDITTADGTVVSRNFYFPLRMFPVDDCTTETLGLWGQLDVSGVPGGDMGTPPEVFDGMTLTMTMRAEDASGTVAEASVDVVAFDP